MSKLPHVLVVDDEPDLRELLVITLGRLKAQAVAADSLSDALERLKKTPFDLCLTDMNLGDGSGLELIKYVNQHLPNMPIAVITAFGNMDVATEAMKLGAFDFIGKPVDMQRLRQLINDGLGISGDDPRGHDDPRHTLIGDSPAMQHLKDQVIKLARSQAPIYISGESGSGKERVARLIHAHGPRHQHPFVAVNCGAIPGELMESEFFGHRKGAFTGAVDDSKGLFREADGGTLFLDEVADLPLHMQVKLLRAIQEKSVRPVGDTKEHPVNIRLLSATHKNLHDEMQAGRFRQDLYYRINVIEAHVPALRERPSDLPALTDFILSRLSDAWQSSKPVLSVEAMERLYHYPFPGNVRELENILERAMTLCEGNTIEPHHLHLPAIDSPSQEPTATSASAILRDTDDHAMALEALRRHDIQRNAGVPLEQYLQDIEKREILSALDATHWNRTAAAKKLGMTFRSLRYRLKKLALDDDGNA